jgi:hypothetical protein
VPFYVEIRFAIAHRNGSISPRGDHAADHGSRRRSSAFPRNCRMADIDIVQEIGAKLGIPSDAVRPEQGETELRNIIKA